MDESDKELIGMLIILALIMSGVQWLFVRFTHWSVSLIITAIIAFIMTFFYVTLSQATPNGGSSGPEASDFIMPLIVISGTLISTLWLVCNFSGTHVPKIVFILPLCIMFIFATGRNTYEYINNTTFYVTYFSTCNIQILDEGESKSSIDVITFKSSASGFSTSIRTKSKESPYPQMTRFADTIVFYYSIQNEQRTTKELPFDYSLFREEQGPSVGYCFWLRSYKTLPMKIVLLPNNKVDLYLGENIVKQYQLNE